VVELFFFSERENYKYQTQINHLGPRGVQSVHLHSTMTAVLNRVRT